MLDTRGFYGDFPGMPGALFSFIAAPRRVVGLLLLSSSLWAAPAALAQAPWPAAAELVFEVGPGAPQGGSSDAMSSIVQARLEELRPRRTEVVAGEPGRIVVRLRSAADRDLAVGVASQIGHMQIALVASDNPIDIQAAQAEGGGAPEGQVLAPTGQQYEPYLLLYLEGPDVDAEALSGAHFSEAVAASHPVNGTPIVNFRLDNAGSRALTRLTNNHIGERIAIVLDGVVVMAPLLSEPITGGEAFIDGGFTHEGAQAIAAIINAGALPAPLTLVEESSEP